MMRMESKIVLAPGVQDGFFCFVPDSEHPDCYVPYLFVILENGKTVDDVREGGYSGIDRTSVFPF